MAIITSTQLNAEGPFEIIVKLKKEIRSKSEIVDFFENVLSFQKYICHFLCLRTVQFNK